MEKNQGTKKLGSQRAHEQLVKSILARYGTSLYLKLWKNNTGAVKVGDRFISFGLGGSSDILGVASDGKIICIEVKTGSAKTSKIQKNFRRMIESMGGYYFEAREVDILDGLINRLSTSVTHFCPQCVRNSSVASDSFIR